MSLDCQLQLLLTVTICLYCIYCISRLCSNKCFCENSC